jgi:hypothetical protein
VQQFRPFFFDTAGQQSVLLADMAKARVIGLLCSLLNLEVPEWYLNSGFVVYLPCPFGY